MVNKLYSSSEILKVWNSHIVNLDVKFACLDLNGSKIEFFDSIFKGKNAQKFASIIVDANNQTYLNDTGFSVSIVDEVKKNGDNEIIKDFSYNIKESLNQIKFWHENHSPLTNHKIIFPMNTGNHWVMGEISMKFNNVNLESVEITLYDPCLNKSHAMSKTDMVILNSEINKIFHTNLEVEEVTLTQKVEQQNDGVSCGLITAENGKSVIKGDGESLQKQYFNQYELLKSQHDQENIAAEAKLLDKEHKEQAITEDNVVIEYVSESTDKIHDFKEVTDRQKLKMIISAYKGDVSKLDFLDDDWELFSSRQEKISDYGFDGVAAVNHQTKQMAFVCAGTDFASPYDLYADGEIVASQIPMQYKQGMSKFSIAIMDKFISSKEDLLSYEFSFIGHSMGSVNAVLAGVELAGVGCNVKMFSYEGLPVANLVSKLMGDNYEPVKYDLTTYVASDNPYDYSKEFGTKLTIDMDESYDVTWLEWSFMNKSHKVKNMLNTSNDDGYLEATEMQYCDGEQCHDIELYGEVDSHVDFVSFG